MRYMKMAAESDSTKMLKEILVLLKQNQEQIGKLEKSLSDIMDEVKKLSRPHPATAPSLQKRRKKTKIPPGCRVSVNFGLLRSILAAQIEMWTDLRRAYKILCVEVAPFGFYLEESVDSSNNLQVLEGIQQEIYDSCGGEEKCEWSKAQIKGAFRRYFLTKYETEKKKGEKIYEEHKAKCRRQGRKRAKLTRRLRAMKEIKWDKKEKGEMAEVMYENYMSSEESCSGSEFEEEKQYNIKKIVWESELLTERKRKLDQFFSSKQTKNSQERRVKRVRIEQLARRELPRDCPAWACNNNNQEDDFQGQ